MNEIDIDTAAKLGYCAVRAMVVGSGAPVGKIGSAVNVYFVYTCLWIIQYIIPDEFYTFKKSEVARYVGQSTRCRESVNQSPVSDGINNRFLDEQRKSCVGKPFEGFRVARSWNCRVFL